MIVHDQHLHSYYSFDSKQPIREYLIKAKELGLSYFVLTDHCDLNYLNKGVDVFFDISKQNKELDELQKEFTDIRILHGIEIGYKTSELHRIKEIINSNKFDLINLSLHESEGVDYFYDNLFKKYGIETTLKKYFEQQLEAIKNIKDFDVLFHIDYGFKTAYLLDNKSRISDYEEYLVRIMNYLIENEKALEINVKVQSFLPIEHTQYILSLYKRLGGKYLTLSSDAHKVEMFRYEFDKYIRVIKECGYDELTYFIKRQKLSMKI